MAALSYHGAMRESPSRLVEELSAEGFVFVAGAEIDRELDGIIHRPEWSEFADSWNNLAIDTYLAEHGTFRRRRHAVFSMSAEGDIRQEPHQPHYQSKTYNTLQGGIERWFEPVSSAVADGDVLLRILRFCAETFGHLSRSTRTWRVEVHQFRIEARSGQDGLPTPEGMHRDGVDYVLVLMICRTNISSGTTSIHDGDGRRLGSFTLTEPLDAALVDDQRVFHGVTPVRAIDESLFSFRDVLVVTLTKV
jgi:hypothetical protein